MALCLGLPRGRTFLNFLLNKRQKCIKFYNRNAPFPLGVRAFAFALAAGNTVVLKGSELCPRTYFDILQAFMDAGLPDGCVNLILHEPKSAAEITNALVSHPLIKKINFTGSTRVGRIISSLAGKHLKPLLMELGGKASAIVMPDANLEKAALQCALGSFLHVRVFSLGLTCIN